MTDGQYARKHLTIKTLQEYDSATMLQSPFRCNFGSFLYQYHEYLPRFEFAMKEIILNNYSGIVYQAQREQGQSLGRLAELVQDRLFMYLYRITLDRDLSQDLMQETLLSMVKNISGLREADHFWPWICRIARSKTQQYFRDRQREMTVRVSVSKEARERTNDDALNLLIHKETLKYISDAVGQLKQQYRDIVRLRCFEQLPYSKIAPLAHCTRQHARVRLHRARKSLKKQLNTNPI